MGILVEMWGILKRTGLVCPPQVDQEPMKLLLRRGAPTPDEKAARVAAMKNSFKLDLQASFLGMQLADMEEQVQNSPRALEALASARVARARAHNGRRVSVENIRHASVEDAHRSSVEQAEGTLSRPPVAPDRSQSAGMLSEEDSEEAFHVKRDSPTFQRVFDFDPSLQDQVREAERAMDIEGLDLAVDSPRRLSSRASQRQIEPLMPLSRVLRNSQADHERRTSLSTLASSRVPSDLYDHMLRHTSDMADLNPDMSARYSQASRASHASRASRASCVSRASCSSAGDTATPSLTAERVARARERLSDIGRASDHSAADSHDSADGNDAEGQRPRRDSPVFARVLTFRTLRDELSELQNEPVQRLGMALDLAVSSQQQEQIDTLTELRRQRSKFHTKQGSASELSPDANRTNILSRAASASGSASARTAVVEGEEASRRLGVTSSIDRYPDLTQRVALSLQLESVDLGLQLAAVEERVNESPGARRALAAARIARARASRQPLITRAIALSAPSEEEMFAQSRQRRNTPVFTRVLTYSDLKDDVASAALEPVQRLDLGLDSLGLFISEQQQQQLDTLAVLRRQRAQYPLPAVARQASGDIQRVRRSSEARSPDEHGMFARTSARIRQNAVSQEPTGFGGRRDSLGLASARAKVAPHSRDLDMGTLADSGVSSRASARAARQLSTGIGMLMAEAVVEDIDNAGSPHPSCPARSCSLRAASPVCLSGDSLDAGTVLMQNESLSALADFGLSYHASTLDAEIEATTDKPAMQGLVSWRSGETALLRTRHPLERAVLELRLLL